LSSWGRLEPCTAAAADEAKRVDTQFTRGARSEAHTRLETIRNAIVYAGVSHKRKRTHEGNINEAFAVIGKPCGMSLKFLSI
jgi:hypothetical protein